MKKLTHESLMSLETYARERQAFRARVMEHKKNRRLAIGSNAALYFEDALTMQYQVQEMLRLERVFEAEGIQAELDVYNPLIPDGSNWKATFMIEYADPDERKAALARLVGVEKTLWMQVDDLPRIMPIANEDLDRTTEDKTASVHFMRFELTAEMVRAVRQGAAIQAGIDHPACHESVVVADAVRQSLAADIDG